MRPSGWRADFGRETNDRREAACLKTLTERQMNPRNGGNRCGSYALALLVLYPLSIGPLVGVLTRLHVAEITGPAYYYVLPIMWLRETIPGGDVVLQAYLELFDS